MAVDEAPAPPARRDRAGGEGHPLWSGARRALSRVELKSLRLSRAGVEALPDARPMEGVHPGFSDCRRYPTSVSWLGLSDHLVGEIGEAVADGLGVEEPHGLLVGGLAEEALARPEHDREDDQPQLVHQVVLD